MSRNKLLAAFFVLTSASSCVRAIPKTYVHVKYNSLVTEMGKSFACRCRELAENEWECADLDEYTNAWFEQKYRRALEKQKAEEKAEADSQIDQSDIHERKNKI